MADFPLKRKGWRWSVRGVLALAALALATGCAGGATTSPGLATEPPRTGAPATATTVTATRAPTNTPRPTVTNLPTVTATRPPTSATPRPSPTRRRPTATQPPAAATGPTLTATVTAEPGLTVTMTSTATTPVETPATPATQTSGDFAPTEPGRWQTSTPTDQMSGGCSTSVLAPYGPAIVRPVEGGLSWYNTAQEDYLLARQVPNVYAYAGPTTRGDGTVTLEVTFSSATTLNMTRIFVPSTEPGCTHTYQQTGTFEFAVP